jgi:malonyl-CoA O-methyltransferase
MPMNRTSFLDLEAVRRQFERRARRGHAELFLAQEVDQGMLARLEPVRLEPVRILEAGCAAGSALPGLARRFPGAHLLGLDWTGGALERASQRLAPPRLNWLSRWLGPGGRAAPSIQTSLVQSRPEALPIPDNAIDLIWSRLMLHWHSPPAALLAEWYRVIRPGGLLTFSCLGVDTLAELRELGAQIIPFPDMHDVGDALVGAGFAEPVLDTERLTVTWRDPATLVTDLRTLGGNAVAGRRKGLATPGARDRWLEAISQKLRRSDGLIEISFEFIYGQAWCPPAKRLPAGLAPLRFVSRKPS